MCIKKLVVIGNGFDIHHGLKTDYANFAAFLEKQNSDFFEKLLDYFPTDTLWNKFESGLAEIDPNTISGDAESELHPTNSEKWTDHYNHSYQERIKEIVDELTIGISKSFSSWIYENSLISILQIIRFAIKNKKDRSYILNAIRRAIFLRYSCKKIKAISRSKQCYYINFNYTRVLEVKYRIKKKHILYIHNLSEDSQSDLIIGHGRNMQNFDPILHLSAEDREQYYEQDNRKIEGNELIREYYSKTHKDTKSIITRIASTWDLLVDIEEVYILGHSVSEVDLPYFVRIWEATNKRQDIKWYVSYYDASEKVKIQNILQSIGIPPICITMKKLSAM